MEFGNGWVPQYMRMPVSHDFVNNLKQNRANIRGLIGSNKILGMDLFIAILLQLPYNLAKYSFILLS